MRSSLQDRTQHRIDSALIGLTGDSTRSLDVRPVVDEDSTVDAQWIPIRSSDDHDWLRVGMQFDVFEQELFEQCGVAAEMPLTCRAPEHLARPEQLPLGRCRLDVPPASDPLQRVFREPDSLVLLAHDAALTWVPQEALAAGVGGVTDHVKHKGSALFIAPDDVAQPVAAVRRPGTIRYLAQRLVQRKRRHIEKSFDVRVNTERLLAMMRELINKRG